MIKYGYQLTLYTLKTELYHLLSTPACKPHDPSLAKMRSLSLNVGSCTSNVSYFLFIYFLNRQKALFTRKYVSFSKKYRFKSIRLAIFRGIPYLCCAHQLALFLFTRQKLTTQLSSCCIAFWGSVYPFTMPGPPGELMTREKLISRESHQKSPTYRYVAKLFLESEFQHKGHKQTKKKKPLLSKILRFSRQQHIQKL